MKEKLAEVEGLLKHAEVQRQEFERQNLLANQALSKALVAASKVSRFSKTTSQADKFISFQRPCIDPSSLSN